MTFSLYKNELMLSPIGVLDTPPERLLSAILLFLTSRDVNPITSQISIRRSILLRAKIVI